MGTVLVACEYSGVVRDAFIEAGHHAISCDFEPGEGKYYDRHYRGDVRKLLSQTRGWDLMIGHPSCTFLCNSGVRWLHERPGRWEQMREGAAFFRWLWEYPIERIALENPVMHKYAKELIGASFTQSIQPYEHGHGETKRTCLWLKNLPPIRPTNLVPGRAPKVHHASPGPNRWKERSRTYEGIGAAFAAQWGPLLPPSKTDPRVNGARVTLEV